MRAKLKSFWLVAILALATGVIGVLCASGQEDNKKPVFRFLDQSLSTNSTADGRTFTVGYQIYSSQVRTGWLGCSLERVINETNRIVVEDETHEPPLTEIIQFTRGTNWYYRDFFVNLEPEVTTPGLFDVMWTVHYDTSAMLSVTQAQQILIGAPQAVRVPILMYHKIGPNTNSYYWLSVDEFRAQMKALKAYGYSAITFGELQQARAGLIGLPPKPMIISIDDGNETLLTGAYPVLADPEINYQATSFLITGRVGQDSSWDHDCCIQTRQLTWEEITNLQATGLIDFQSHSATHPYLIYSSDEELAAELLDSREAIQQHLGTAPSVLAYPYGFYNLHCETAARKAGYFAAVTAWGGIERDCRLKYELKRVGVAYTTSVNYNPDFPPDFFFSFEDDFPTPNIIVDSREQALELVDADTGAVVTTGQVLPGQTVKLRFTAWNDWTPTDVIPHLRIDSDADAGNGVIFDSRQADPPTDVATNFPTGQQVFEWMWNVPTNAPAGAYLFEIKIQDTNQVFVYYNSGWFHGLDMGELLPDLQAASVGLVEPLAPLGSNQVAFEVRNIGNAAAGHFLGKIVISEDAVFDDSGIVLANFEVPALEEGQSYSGMVSVQMPEWIQPTVSYYLGLAVDYGDLVTNGGPGEVLELTGHEVDNNTVLAAVSWRPAPPAPIFDPAKSTHLPEQWSREGNFDLWWLPPTHPVAMAGYSVLLDEEPLSEPEQTVTTTEQHFAREGNGESDHWYLHVRAVDAAGEWGQTAHFGPFKVDETPPTVPMPISPAGGRYVAGLRPQFVWQASSDNFTPTKYELKVLEEVEADGEVGTAERLYKTNLDSTAYSAAEDEVLPQIKCYWSVRARDFAGNFSEWSPIAEFTPVDPLDAVDLQVPYYPQEKFEHAWGIPAAGAMLLKYYGYDLKPWEIAGILGKGATDATTPEEFFNWMTNSQSSPSHGWTIAYWGGGDSVILVRRIAQALSAGNPVLVARMDSGLWSWPPAFGSEAVLAVGYSGLNSNDAMYFHDPASAMIHAAEMERTCTWRQFMDVLNQNWLPLGEVALIYSALTNANEGATPVSLSVLPGTGLGHAGLRWEHLRNGTNCVAELGWDGKANWAGYFYNPNPPEEFPIFSAEEGKPFTLSGVTKRDSLRVVPYVANGGSNTVSAMLDLRIYDASNGMEVLSLAGTNSVTLLPYSSGNQEALALSQGLAGPEIQESNDYYLELVLRSSFTGDGEEKESWDTNRFYFRVEPWEMGTLSVTLGPVEATNSHFTWKVDSGAWEASGATLSNLSLGTHWVEFKNVNGWTAPASEMIELTNTEAAKITRDYTEATQSLSVTLEPETVAGGDAAWRLDAGAWQGSGSVLLNLSLGTHWLEFRNVNGWTAPASETVELSNGVPLEIIRSYTEGGQSVSFTLEPGTLAAGGAAWRMDGGVWNVSGSTVTGVEPGEHLVEFAEIAGWVAPTNETVMVETNTVTELTRRYTVAGGWLHVAIGPTSGWPGAFWQIDGVGPWHRSGEMSELLAPGSHVVAFSETAGWRNPEPETVEVVTGATNELARDYVSLSGALTVSLSPVEAAQGGGQWRLDGGAWLEERTIDGLTVGYHLIEFKTLPGWRRPEAQNIIIVAEETNAVSATYIQKLAPSIMLQPVEQTRLAGASVAFGVTAVGTEPLTYEWYKDGVRLPDTEKCLGTGSREISLSQLESLDAGNYSVLITNMYGVSTSEVALLRIVSRVIVWGDEPGGLTNVPVETSNTVAIAVGGRQCLALTAESVPLAWSDGEEGESFVPTDLTNAVAIAAGVDHVMALRTDGSVVGWGSNDYGQIDIPAGLSNVTAIAAGDGFSAALQADGNLAIWGRADTGVTNIPAAATNLVQIACGLSHVVALRADGRAVAWGANDFGQAVAPESGDFVAVVAGGTHSLGLMENGEVVAWGAVEEAPPGLSDIVATAAGDRHSVALSGAGVVYEWGSGRTSAPPYWLTNFFVEAVAVRGSNFGMALIGDGSPFIIVPPWGQAADVGESVSFRVVAGGAEPLSYRWCKDGMPLSENAQFQGAEGKQLRVAGVNLGTAGEFSVVVSNAVGIVTSQVARLTLAAPTWQWVRESGVTNLTFDNCAVDIAGNFYVVGKVVSTNEETAEVTEEYLVSKYDNFGNLVSVWPTGISNASSGCKLVLDTAGNLYVAGAFKGEAIFGTNALASLEHDHVFVVKYSPDGELEWANEVPSDRDAEVNAFCVDTVQNVFVTGYFKNDPTNTENCTFYLCKFGPGGGLEWVKDANSTNSSSLGQDVIADVTNGVQVLIQFIGNLELGANSFESVSKRATLLARFDSAGEMIAGEAIGAGSGDILGRQLTLGPAGEICISGDFAGQSTFGTNTFAAEQQIFLLKLSDVGEVTWAVAPRVDGAALCLGHATDEGGNIYLNVRLSGQMQFRRLILNGGINGSDYLVKFSPEGQVLWAEETVVGSETGLVVDAVGNVYQAGNLTTELVLGMNNFTVADGGSSFIAKMEFAPVLVTQPESQIGRYGHSVSFSLTASGTGLTYEWSKNGVPLSEQEGRIWGTRSNVLTIGAAELSDAGVYSVRVRDRTGLAGTQGARLTVVGYVQALVDAASSGDTVLVPPGEYLEQLVLDKQITVQGTSAGMTIIQSYTNAPVLQITSNAVVSLHNATVRNGLGTHSGGIWNAGSLMISKVVISNCVALEGGGAVANFGNCLVENSTFWGNQGSAGGAVFNAGWMALTNCTISGNASDSAAGGIMNSGVIVIASSTIVSNRSASVPGGVMNADLDKNNCQLLSTIIARNEGGDLGGELLSLGYNLIGQDPFLAPLDDYGGPTPTHALLSNSPAIDQGFAGGLVVDQRGFPRIANWPNLADAADGADIGAFELAVDYSLPGVTNEKWSAQGDYGSNLVFSVEADGGGPLWYQWRYNGMDIIDSEVVTGANTPALQFSNLKPHHAGEYSLVITNYAGSYTSQIHSLSVITPGPVLSRAQISSEGKFTCEFTGLPGESYVVEETIDFSTWTLITNIASATGEIQLVEADSLSPENHFYRARLVAEAVALSAEAGPMSGNGVDRNYDDGYVRVDSLANAENQTYYWGYDSAEQSDSVTLSFHARGVVGETAVWIVTDIYNLNGVALPPAPYRGEFQVPDPIDAEHPPLSEAPMRRTIRFQ